MRGPALRILQINDVYSLEALPRFATLVKEHTARDPADRTLVVVAGDFLAPSILSSLDGGRGMVDCLNTIGVTHVTFGNHEDDIHPPELRARIRELHATWLGTNVRGFEPRLPLRDVVEVGAPGGRTVRVGIVGVVMDDAAVYRGVPFGGATLDPPNAAVLCEATALVADGCATIVAMTHQPIPDDRTLAHAAGAARIAVVVGGHEHVPFLETIDGTPIVKTGMDATKAAIIDLVWPAEAPANGAPDVPRVTVRLEETSIHAEDPDLRRRVDGHMAQVHLLETATLMVLAPGETLSSVGVRSRPASFATLLCSFLRDALAADACLFNAGGIRASREYVERFTYGDLKAEVPFDNEIVAVLMAGGVLRDAIAASRAQSPGESGAYLHADDRVVVDEPSHVVTAVAGAPLDEGRLYCVAIVRNLLAGMDHIEPLVRFASDPRSVIPPPGSGRDVKIVLVDAFAHALWRRLGGFDAVDANHDGEVTQSEIAAAVARLTRAAPSDVGAALLLNALDVKHRGAVTRDELRPEDEKPPE
ncbi:MAG TPA: 5'-nucleotidase C-terminal domain-containing protein [Polyangiaceae bacterium]